MADVTLTAVLRGNIDNLNSSMSSAVRTVTDASRQIDTQATNATRAIQGINPASRGAAFALTNFGRVAQDAAYGPQAIANNLNPLIEGFQVAQREARETGTSLTRNLLGVLTGAGGIGVAISLVTAAIGFASVGLTFWKGRHKESKEAIDEHSKALATFINTASKETATLSTLYTATQNQTLSIKDRKQAVDELQSQYPAYFKNLSDEAILAGKASSAYESLTQAILGKAAVSAAQEQLQTVLKPLVERAIKQAAFVAANPGADASGRDVRKIIKNIQKEAEKPGNGLILPIESFLVKGNLARQDNTAPIKAEAAKQYDVTEQIRTDQEKQVKKWQDTIQQLLKQFGTGIITSAGGALAKPIEGFAILEAEISKLTKSLENAILKGDMTAAHQLAIQLTTVQQRLKEVQQQFLNLLTMGQRMPDLTRVGGGVSSGGALGTDPATLQGMQNAIDVLEKYRQKQVEVRLGQDEKAKADEREKNNLQAITGLIGGGLTQAFESALTGTQSFVSAMGQFLTQLISRLVAAALAAAALSALLSFTGLGGLLGISSAKSGFGNIFKGLSGLNFMAQGGVVTGPTLAMIGEGRDSEAVIPLPKLDGMLSSARSEGGGKLEARLEGSTLVLWNNRSNKQNGRTS